MPLSVARSNVVRSQKSIADLKSKDAAETKKEADLSSKINRAAEAANRTKSTSTMQTKFREIERHQKSIASVSSKRAQLAKQIVAKTTELNRYLSQLEREEKKERDTQTKNANKMQNDMERRQRSYALKLRAQNMAAAINTTKNIDILSVDYDVFISHASEDKDMFVRELAEALRDSGLSIWYDEFTLKWGDSLRKEIDRGLSQSKFGIVVLSESFFAKEWPQAELDGLVSLEMGGESRILPIWHKISV